MPTVTKPTNVSLHDYHVALGARTWADEAAEFAVVELPAGYDPTTVTADDILNDPAITLIGWQARSTMTEQGT